MRPVGFTLLAALIAAPLTWAQVPGVTPGQPIPGAPVGQPGAQPGAPAPDPKLDPHLKGWELKMGGLTNFAADIALTKKDSVFQKPREYDGSVLCAKPNSARLRLEALPKPPPPAPGKPAEPVDFEAYICNGAFLYEYNGLKREVTEYKLGPNAGGAGDNLMLDFLAGFKADEAKRRFDIKVFNEDDNYVYLDIKPRLQKDQQEFVHVRFALYGPRTQVAYLPAQVWLQKPSGDTELWKFSNPRTNVPNVDQKVFDYVPVQGWPLKKAQVPPAGPPGGVPPKGPGVPTGGAVRP
jgi:TIGR03009 family protein